MTDTIKIYRGENTIDDIDYTSQVGSRSGTGDVVITGQTHTVGRNYYYAARQTSTLGREEKNMTKVVKFLRLLNGEMAGARPNPIYNLRAVGKDANKIELSWIHARMNNVTPAAFNVYCDYGQGSANLINDYQVLLLHGETFIDSGKTKHVLIDDGNHQFDESIYKFGSRSLKLTDIGSGYVYITGHSDFYLSGDFSIDGWVRFDDSAGACLLFWGYNSSNNDSYGLYAHVGDGKVWFNANDFGTDSITVEANVSLTLNTWHHVSISRSDNNFYLGFNGTIVQTATDAIAFPNIPSDKDFAVWSYGDGNVWVDELQVLNGQSLYTSNYTLPTKPYGPIIHTEPYRGTTRYKYTTPVLSENVEHKFYISAQDLSGNESNKSKIIEFIPKDYTPAIVPNVLVNTIQ